MKWTDFTKWIKDKAVEHQSEVNVEEIWQNLEPRIGTAEKTGQASRIGWVMITLFLVLGSSAIYYTVQKSSPVASDNEILTEDIIGDAESQAELAPMVIENETETHTEDQTEKREDISEAGDEDMKRHLTNTSVYRNLHSNPSSFADDTEITAETGNSAESINQFSSTVLSKNEETFREGEEEHLSVPRIADDVASEPSSDVYDLQSYPEVFEGETALQEAGHGERTTTNRDVVEDGEVTTMSSGNGDIAPAEGSGVEHSAAETGEDLAMGIGDVPNTTNITFTDEAPSVTEIVEASNPPADLTLGREDTTGAAVAMASAAGPLKKRGKDNRCPNIGTFAGKPWLFMAGVEAGVAYPLRQFKSSGAEGNTLMGYRENRETSMFRTQYGLVFSAVHPSGFTLSSGFGFASLLERYEHYETQTQTEMVYGLQAIAVNVYGDTTYIYGDVPQTTTSEINKKVYNRYNYFEFPVLLGYQQDIKQWSLGVFTGAYLGLLTSATGQIADESGGDVDIFDVRDELFSKKFTASYYFGGRAAFNFERGISVFIKPHIRWAPHDTSSDAYPVQTRYLFPGANVGMVYQFRQ